MTTLLITAFLLLLFVLLPLVLRRLGKTSDQKPDSSYVAVKSLLTPAERSCYGVLCQATGTDYVVFAKVRLADLIKPQNSSDRGHWRTAFNRISSKHVDFVVCNSADLSLVAVVELDDSTHAKADRKDRDAFVDSALTSARIPILHVPASLSYSPAQLRSQIDSLVREGQQGQPS